MKKKKIGLFMVFPLTQPGGAQKYFIELAANLNNSNTQVDVITMNRSFLRWATIALHFYYRFDFKELFAKNLDKVEDKQKVLEKMNGAQWIETSFKNLKKTLKTYDVIYTKNEVAELGLLKFLGYNNLPPVIVGVHTPVIYPFTQSSTSKFHNVLYGSFVYRWLLQGVKFVHVVNYDDKKLFSEKFGIKANLIHYPFLLSEKKGLKRKKVSSAFNILFVGRLSEQKGIDVLIEIIKLLSKEDIFKNLIFKIAGFGDSNLESQLKALNKNFDNVEYLAYIKSDLIDDFYEWTDIVLIPSRYETVNYVALETGSHKKIAVATDIPGPRDVIIDDKTGFLIKDLSPKAFINKILDLYNLKKSDKSSFNKIGDVAYKHIDNTFNPEKIYREMENLFKSLS